MLKGDDSAVARAVRADSEARLLSGDYFTGVVLLQTYFEMLTRALLNPLIDANGVTSRIRASDFDGQRRAVCHALEVAEDDQLLNDWREHVYWVRGRGVHRARIGISDEQANKAHVAVSSLARELVRRATESGLAINDLTQK